MHVYDCERHRNLECLVKIGLLCSWLQVSDLYKVSFLFSLNFLKINWYQQKCMAVLPLFLWLLRPFCCLNLVIWFPCLFFVFQITERDLIPNGRNIRVTNDNKLEYIEWVGCLFYDVLLYAAIWRSFINWYKNTYDSKIAHPFMGDICHLCVRVMSRWHTCMTQCICGTCVFCISC